MKVRISPSILSANFAALGEDINRGAQPMLEFVTDMNTVWDTIEGNP